MLDTKEMVFVNYILDNVHGFIGLTFMEDKIERLLSSNGYRTSLN